MAQINVIIPCYNQEKYIAEAMFWARSCLFKPIQHKFSLSDFGSASKDGHTLAHIFERILATYHEYKTSDNMKLISRIKAKKKIKHIISRVCRFILQKKISYSNILTIKFLRIPVYRR